MEDTRFVHVKQPDAVELEYSRILSEIQGGEFQFAKLPETATFPPQMRFLNPGPAPVVTDTPGRFIEEGDCPSDVEADAR